MENIIHLAETKSTNQFLSNLLRKEKPAEGSIILADLQTAGKGQADSLWESERGKNLTFSMVLYPDFMEAQDQFIISQLVSLALIDTLVSKVKNTSIKWPNDIYVGDKKIAGILIENVLCGKYLESCVIGIGLNVNQEAFLSDAPNPISLKQLTNENFDLTLLLEEIRTNIYVRYMQVVSGKKGAIIDKYLSNLYRKTGFYPYQSQGTIFKAKINSVLPSGELVIETQEGEVKTVGFKEIDFIL